MTHYSIETKDQIFLKGSELFSFSKSMSKNVDKNVSKNLIAGCSENPYDHAKQSKQKYLVRQTTSKKVIEKNYW